jgi:hypothetical protein
MGGSMRLRRPESDDARDTSFELPDSYFEDIKPGFERPARKPKSAVLEGHHRFPRISAAKDVPQAPLAERIREPR